MAESQLEKEDDKRFYIKKPLNAFMLYMREERPKVVAQCNVKESATINQILGQRVRLAAPLAACWSIGGLERGACSLAHFSLHSGTLWPKRSKQNIMKWPVKRDWFTPNSTPAGRPERTTWVLPPPPRRHWEASNNWSHVFWLFL